MQVMADPLPNALPLPPDTIFVVGNGPSLAQTDRSHLDDFAWIGMNVAYREWAHTGKYPRFYACLDLIVGDSHKEAIASMVESAPDLGIERFLLRSNLRSDVPASDRIVFWDDLPRNLPLRDDRRLSTGSHAAIWAADMGFSTIVLLGIDLNYVEIVPTAARDDGDVLRIIDTGGNPNYYFADYQKLGDRYTVPNPVPGTHMHAWRRARKAIEGLGADVYNAAPGSALPYFAKGDLSRIAGRSVVRPTQSAPEPPPIIVEDADLTGLTAQILPEWFGTVRHSGELSDIERYGFKSRPISKPVRSRRPFDLFVTNDAPTEFDGGAILWLTPRPGDPTLEALAVASDTLIVVEKAGGALQISARANAPRVQVDAVLALSDDFLDQATLRTRMRSPAPSPWKRRTRALKANAGRVLRRRATPQRPIGIA